MQYRQLGRSGLRVSVLTMGTMTFGGQGTFGLVGNTHLAEARRQIDLCLDAGVNLLDTADMYSTGLSEEMIGEVMRGKWDSALIATKVRFPMGSGPNDAGLSRHHIIAACEASLRRLGTDHIDLYQVHQWDGMTPLEETLEALDSLVRAGKVRYIGSSNYSAWHLMKALAVSDQRLLSRFVSQQIHYSLMTREAEYELIPLSVDQGVGVLVWSPLAGGLLSGKHRRGRPTPDGSRLAQNWIEPPIRDVELMYDIVETLIDVAEEHEMSAAQVALAWLLQKPAVTSLVIGARTTEQLISNLAAADLVLTDKDVERLETVSAQPLLYPYWHQAWRAPDRLSAADLTLLSRHLP